LKKYLDPSVRDTTEYGSIHFLSVPEVNSGLIDTDIEKLVGVMQKVILLGRVIRDRKKLSLRHPCKQLVTIVDDFADVEKSISQVLPYIYEELNVKNVKLTKEKKDYGIELKAKANFAVLATKAKDKMKALSAAIEKLNDAQVQELLGKGRLVLDGVELTPEDIKISPKINSEQFGQFEADFDENVTILLDVAPDEEMLNEGVLRDVVNRIQRLRRELKLVPTDEIVVYYRATPEKSKLGALVSKSAEFVEASIKKPFRAFDSTLTLSSKSKTFDFTELSDGKLDLWIEKVGTSAKSES
jgi:isoleucyl-tRNA synthetase